MAWTWKSAGRTGLAAAAVLAAAAAALAISPAGGVARGSSPCPTFRVLGNDKIGKAVLPKGTYDVKVAGGFSCTKASSQFTRFLEDYDGNLPDHWAVVPKARGKAAFTHHGNRRFSVSRQGNGGGGGGGHHHSPQLGTRCPGAFKVLHNDRIGPLRFPAGNYLLYIPSRSQVSCAKASKLFTKFLSRPDGSLPHGWGIKAQTAVFFKRAHPQAGRFRVDPGT